MIPYKSRNGGPTCTIFAPYDCDNNCAFCVNKAEYADPSTFSLPKILDMITLIDGVTPRCDFVISGGEPFANIDGLNAIIEAIPPTHRLYINTTFPCTTSTQKRDNCQVIGSSASKITALNISRHLAPFPNECEDTVIAALPVRARINCVLPERVSGTQVREFVRRWAQHGTPIQFRRDYTKTTLENLYDESSDEILKCLHDEFPFVAMKGCRIRNSYLFEYREGNQKPGRIFYHKTLPYSSVVEKDPDDGATYTILYDVLIKQDGSLHSDWDGTELDLEKFRSMKYEPDDARTIKQSASARPLSGA